jgi:RimJ/RimL family protein N-acetyltransferase
MNQQEIPGERVVLRPARIEDRRLIHKWLACSDVAALMNGPPTYPDKPAPTWDEFRDSYAAHYFDDSAPELGRCFFIVVDGAQVGQVNYNDIAEHNGAKRTELDIWMSSREQCGRGYGTDALETLCRYLAGRFGVREFLVQASARNSRAIRAYESIGFKRIDLSDEAAREAWGPGDYQDSIYMVKAASITEDLSR